MRSVKLIALGLMAVATLADGAEAQVRVGVRGGAAITTISGDELNDPSSAAGPLLGAHVELGVSEVFGIDLGVGWVGKGVKDRGGTEEVTLDIDYFELPILATFRVPTDGGVAPRLYTGPVLGFKTSCDVAVVDGASRLEAPCDDPLFAGETDIRSFDFGALAGGGVSIAVGETASLDFDVMYNLGLRTLEVDNDEDPNRNRSFQLTAGLSFTVGG